MERNFCHLRTCKISYDQGVSVLRFFNRAYVTCTVGLLFRMFVEWLGAKARPLVTSALQGLSPSQLALAAELYSPGQERDTRIHVGNCLKPGSQWVNEIYSFV